MLPLAVPVHAISPVPVPVIWIEPVDVAHADGLFTVPVAITGFGFTVIVT